MIERTIFSLRRTAHRIALELKQRGQDIPLDEDGKVGVTRFTDEQHRILKERELVLHGKPLSGQSIRSLRKAGRKFRSTWHLSTLHDDEIYRAFETLPSRTSEVATLPGLFLPNSNGKPLKAQLEMVAQLSEEFESEGLRAIIGEVPDYVELVFNRLDESSAGLGGHDYKYGHCVRTVTPVGSSVAHVVSFDFHADDGLDLRCWPPGEGHDALWAVPLVVPVENGQ